MRLSGKVALVTGSGRGIGAAIVKGFAREGAQVVINYRKSEDGARETWQQIKAFGGQAIMVQADINKENDIAHLVEQAGRAFGKIDILVNNAGESEPSRPFLEAVWGNVREHIEAHLKGIFLLNQAVVPGMIEKKWGRIIHIGTEHYFRPDMILYGYWIAKAGALALMSNLAFELAPYGITVNCVSPGFIDTDLHAGASRSTRNARIEEAIKVRQAIPRVGKVEDVVGTAVYFASDESSFVTGCKVPINGGGIRPTVIM